MKKKLIGYVGIVCLAAAGFGFWFFGQDAGEAEQVSAHTIQIATGDVIDTIFVDGTVEADRRVQVRTKVSGEVKEILVVEGDQVSEGDTIARLDTARLEYELDQARAELKSAEIALARAELEARLKRFEAPDQVARAKANLEEAENKLASLEQSTDVDREKLEEARAAFRQASAIYLDVSGQETIEEAEKRYQKAEREYHLAEQALKDAEIRAPISGRITSLNIAVGDILGTTSQVAAITDFEMLKIVANIDEFDIRHIQPGQRARIVADAYPDQRFQGEVYRIADEARRDGGVVVFATTISVGNPRDLLKPGMTAEIEIITEHREDVLLIPTEAITYSEGQPVVTVNEDGEYNPRKVQLGLTQGEFTEIREGLFMEDSIVIFTAEADLPELSTSSQKDTATIPRIPGTSSSTGTGSGGGGGMGGGRN